VWRLLRARADKVWGFLFLNNRKEVIVMTKRLLELCPAAPLPSKGKHAAKSPPQASKVSRGPAPSFSLAKRGG
jgi:hypothetical protein